MQKTAKKKTGAKISFIEVHRRKQILEIAIDLLAEHGYNQTTLADVAKKAGFSKSVVFYYFNNKEELASQINTVLLQEFREHIRKSLKASDSGPERLKNYIRAYMNYIKENGRRFMTLFELGINFNSGKKDPIFSQPLYFACHSAVRRALELDEIINAGSKLNSANLIAVIQGMMDGVGIQFISDPNSIDLDGCCQMIIEMIDGFLKSRVPSQIEVMQ